MNVAPRQIFPDAKRRHPLRLTSLVLWYPDYMSNLISPRKLTAKQEKFAQAIVDGYSQSKAYKLAYDTSNMLPATIHNSAYKLMHHGEIAARISEAREAVATELLVTRKHSAESLVTEYETNLLGAREDRAWAPANKAIEGIARLTGNLEPSAAQTEVNIVKVTVVLPSSTPTVDAEGYTVLPHGDEGANTRPDLE